MENDNTLINANGAENQSVDSFEISEDLKINSRTDRTGEEMVSSQGQLMKIIAYRSSLDIDVQFEDGTIVPNRKYSHFKSGSIKNPSLSKTRLGEERKYGSFIAKIIVYRKSNDIDVEFSDGSVVEHTTYQSFRTYKIPCPDTREKFTNSKIGEKSIADNGQEMEILEYKDSRHITIKFDDGTIVTDKTYSAFRHGNIGNPNNICRGKARKTTRVGEKRKASNGQEMEIVEYYQSNNITVRFEDGTIVPNRSYQAFLTGLIRNPNTSTSTFSEELQSTTETISN
jgi:hypothetical protein